MLSEYLKRNKFLAIYSKYIIILPKTKLNSSIKLNVLAL